MRATFLAAATAAILAALTSGCDMYFGDDQIITEQPDGGAEVAPPEIWSPTDPLPGQPARFEEGDLIPIVGYCAQAPCRLWADGRPTSGQAWATVPHVTFKVVVEGGVAIAANGGEVIMKSGQFVVAASGLVPGWWTLTVGQGQAAVQSAPPWMGTVLFDTSTFEVYDGPQ